MKIRLEGTPAGVEAFAAFLRATTDVQQESSDYCNRPPSKLVRRYMDVELLPAAQEGCTAVGPQGARCELAGGHASSHMAHITRGLAAWGTTAPPGEDEPSSAAALAETRREMDREAGDYGADT